MRYEAEKGKVGELEINKIYLRGGHSVIGEDRSPSNNSVVYYIS